MLRDLDGFVAVRLSLYEDPPQLVLFAPEGEQPAVSFALNGLATIQNLQNAINDAMEQWALLAADVPQ